MSEPAPHSIHAGKDGWLFLIAGSNNVITQFNRSGFMAYQIEAWRRLVLDRQARLKALGIAYRHMVVPDKLSLYETRLDGISVDPRLSPARRLAGRMLWRRPRKWHLVGGLRDALALRRALIDLVGPMRAWRGPEELFLQTDSHWSFAGRLLAYRAICRSLGAPPVEDFADRPSREAEHVGDLGVQIDPPRGESIRLYDLQRDAVRIFASPIVLAREAVGQQAALHLGAHVIYRNETARDPRRLVLFGDSNAGFLPTMLTILLAETFREVHFIWNTALDWAYIERVRPDIVLSELAERFMYIVPTDDLDIDAYARERYGPEIAAFEASSGSDAQV